MLIRFNISNFLSFDKETEFNMLESTSLKTHKHHVQKVGKLNVLKNAAIYGANGAGKSNLIQAIEYLQEFVEDEKIRLGLGEYKFRLNPDNVDLPSSLEIEFSISNKVYSYGITFDNDVIEEEWLYESENGKLIFEREITKNGKSTIKLADRYSRTEKQKLILKIITEDLLKTHELFIGQMSNQLKIKEISAVRDFIKHGIRIIYPRSEYNGLFFQLYYEDDFKAFLNNIICTLDTGVQQVSVVSKEIRISELTNLGPDLIEELRKLGDEGIDAIRVAPGYTFYTKKGNKYYENNIVATHKDNNGKDIELNLHQESDGTCRLLDIIPVFKGLIDSDTSYIIDEIDQSLHPILLYSFIQRVTKQDNTRGQFIFTTHEANLLDLELFRQDEIWFVEKDRNTGSTQLYPLSDFKPRNDLNIRKGYLNGRFGAIPFMANLEDLKWQSDGI